MIQKVFQKTRIQVSCEWQIIILDNEIVLIFVLPLYSKVLSALTLVPPLGIVVKPHDGGQEDHHDQDGIGPHGFG